MLTIKVPTIIQLYMYRNKIFMAMRVRDQYQYHRGQSFSLLNVINNIKLRITGGWETNVDDILEKNPPDSKQ